MYLPGNAVRLFLNNAFCCLSCPYSFAPVTLYRIANVGCFLIFWPDKSFSCTKAKLPGTTSFDDQNENQEAMIVTGAFDDDSVQ